MVCADLGWPGPAWPGLTWPEDGLAWTEDGLAWMGNCSRTQKKTQELAAQRKAGQKQVGLLAIGGLFMLLIGNYAPASFMQHFIVFALACFVGFQVIWNVSHALHTPLMAVTNAISGIIILGALLQIGSSNQIVMILASISVLIATINIVGGFMVTRRMLAMFQKS